jgi:hypothetical protein
MQVEPFAGGVGGEQYRRPIGVRKRMYRLGTLLPSETTVQHDDGHGG